MSSHWRERAVCRTWPDPTLWDETVDDGGPSGEPRDARERRQATAKSLCSLCPVTAACLADARVQRDEGIRAGRRLPPLHGKTREVAA